MPLFIPSFANCQETLSTNGRNSYNPTRVSLYFLYQGKPLIQVLCKSIPQHVLLQGIPCQRERPCGLSNMGWLKAAQTANRIHSHNGYQPLDSHRIHTVLIVVIVVVDINPCLRWNQWIFAVDSSETCFVCLCNPRKQRYSFLLRVKEELFELLCFLLLDWHIL